MKLDLFKIEQEGNKVYIKMLVHNDRVWSGNQWYYSYVRTNDYPINYVNYATNFVTRKSALKWIREHTPRQIEQI